MSDPTQKAVKEAFLNACYKHDIQTAKDLIFSKKVQLDGIYDGFTFLHMAVCDGDAKLVNFILRLGANPDSRDSYERTALHLAILKRRPELIEVLLNYKADILDVGGFLKPKSALSFIVFQKLELEKKQMPDLAQELYNIGVIANLILQFGMVNLDENYYRLCGAILNGDFFALRQLVEQMNDVNFSPAKIESLLEFAVDLNQLEIVEFLLIRGADPNRGLVLFRALRQKNLEMVKLLLSYRADVNCGNESKMTPLYYATNLDSLTLMETILQHGANVDGSSVYEVNGKTALHRACRKGFLDGVKLLLHYSANVNSRDKHGNTPLHECLRYPEIVEVLLKNGALVDATNYWDQTPVHLACGYGKLRSVKLLLEHGAEPTALDKQEKTILHYAARSKENLPYVADFTVNRGYVNIHATDENGNTPLHEISNFHEYCDNFLQLLRRGADLNIRNYSDCYPDHKHDHFHSSECPITEYVRRLQALGYEIKNDTEFFRDMRRENGSTVLPLPYIRELEALRGYVIGRNPKTTLYDMLYASRSCLARISASEGLMEALVKCNGDFENWFHCFGSVLNAQYHRALIRRGLVSGAKCRLDWALGTTTPEICSERIFRYLSDADVTFEIELK